MNDVEIEGNIENIRKDGDDTIIEVRIKHLKDYDYAPIYRSIDDFVNANPFTSREEVEEMQKAYEEKRQEIKKKVYEMNDKIDNIKLGAVILKL